MKIKLLLLLTLGLSFTITAQEFDCTCGVVIGNNQYSDRPLTIVHSQTFKAKCKKGNSLYLDTGDKQKMRLQFISDILSDNPSILQPFKNNTLLSAINVWVVESEGDFKQRIDNHYGTSSLSYNIIKIDDFIYDSNRYKDFNSDIRKKDDKKMREYLLKN
ncbi:MAG: hypothetical protein CMO82_13695 [Winogradskyella sp.]|nr:hypothetical protein [Winogradskyella sp.]|tara:strand:- start:4935 stop:5414 length:480 start_codon:yes stop_codon:yes gene_type:complete